MTRSACNALIHRLPVHDSDPAVAHLKDCTSSLDRVRCWGEGAPDLLYLAWMYGSLSNKAHVGRI